MWKYGLSVINRNLIWRRSWPGIALGQLSFISAECEVSIAADAVFTIFQSGRGTFSAVWFGDFFVRFPSRCRDVFVVSPPSLLSSLLPSSCIIHTPNPTTTLPPTSSSPSPPQQNNQSEMKCFAGRHFRADSLEHVPRNTQRQCCGYRRMRCGQLENVRDNNVRL